MRTSIVKKGYRTSKRKEEPEKPDSAVMEKSLNKKFQFSTTIKEINVILVSQMCNIVVASSSLGIHLVLGIPITVCKMCIVSILPNPRKLKWYKAVDDKQQTMLNMSPWVSLHLLLPTLEASGRKQRSKVNEMARKESVESRETVAELEKEHVGKGWNKIKTITTPFSWNPADFCCQSLSSFLLVLEPTATTRQFLLESPRSVKEESLGHTLWSSCWKTLIVWLKEV